MTRRFHRVMRCAATLMLVLAPSSLRAGIIALGDVTPISAPEQFEGSLFVGDTGAGVLIVNDGSLLQSHRNYIGNGENSRGTVLIDGAGTVWQMSRGSALYIGIEGRGELIVTNGANVAENVHDPSAPAAFLHAFLGSGSSGSGRVSVVGTDSLLNIADLWIGNAGDGRLDVSSGGTVQAQSVSIGSPANGQGSLHVSGAGSRLSADEVLLIRSSGGEIRIENGGHFSAPRVSSYEGPGQITNLAIDGPNSQFNVASTFDLGRSGVGDSGQISLNISDGGVANTGAANVSPGGLNAQLNVDIDGAESRWTVSGDARISQYRGSTVAVNLSNGGLLEATGDVILNFDDEGGAFTFDQGALKGQTILARPDDFHGVGTIEAKGWLLRGNWTVSSFTDLPTEFVLDELPGQHIAVSVDWNATVAPLGVDDGELNITDGSDLSSAWGYAGYFSGSKGAINVHGRETRWRMGDHTYVGYDGIGILNIFEGAVVNGNSASVQSSDSALVGVGSTVAVDGVNTEWNLDGMLEIGRQGSLIVTGGGVVSSGRASLSASSAQATATIDGAGSRWTIAGTLEIGQLGHSLLALSNGGYVESQETSFRGSSRSNATVNIAGSESLWHTIGDISTTDDCDLDLSISDGGRLTVGGDFRFSQSTRLHLTLVADEEPSLEIGGDLLLNGELQIDLANGTALTPGQEFLIVSVAGNVDGAFPMFAEGALVGKFGGAPLSISYHGGDGNDIVLTSLGLSGDYDHNGVVDSGDFLVWQRGESAHADGIADLGYWAANYGYANENHIKTHQTPEPAAIMLALVALAMCYRRATRSCRRDLQRL